MISHGSTKTTEQNQVLLNSYNSLDPIEIPHSPSILEESPSSINLMDARYFYIVTLMPGLKKQDITIEEKREIVDKYKHLYKNAEKGNINIKTPKMTHIKRISLPSFSIDKCMKRTHSRMKSFVPNIY